MEEQDVELVKQIIKDELGPALEAEGKRIEANVITAQHAFQEDIRREVRKDHAENRMRLESNYTMAAKAVAGNEFIIKHLNTQDEEMGHVRTMLGTLLAEVKLWTGRREGEAAADAKHDASTDKKIGWIWKAGGALGAGGVYKWLADHFHWFGGR